VTVVTRAGLGRELTYGEVDGNFTALHGGEIVVASNGDISTRSTDPSKLRDGTWTNSFGALYTLFGEWVMYYQSHNCAINPATGDFLAVDEAEACVIFGLGESGLYQRFDSQTTTAGHIPGVDAPWTRSYFIDASGFNGAVGASTRNAGSFTSLNASTTLTVAANTRVGAPGWNDNVEQIRAISGPDAPPVTEWADGMCGYEFLTGQNYACFANFHMKHDYKVASMQYPHLHFVTTTDLGGVVRLAFKYTQARRVDDPTGSHIFPVAQTLYLNVTIPAGAGLTHWVAEMPEGFGIPGTNVNVDSLVCMRMYRDGTSPEDTFTQSIWALTVDLHYETDKDNTPLRTPPFYP